MTLNCYPNRDVRNAGAGPAAEKCCSNEAPRGIPANFIRNSRGTAAVEFALIAPFFLLTILFLMMMGYIMILSESLSYATQKASRLIATGQAQSAQWTQQQFITNGICPYVVSMINCTNIIVNVQPVPTNDASYPSEYYSFVNTAQTALLIPTLSNSQTQYCPGNAGGYVYVQILYPIPIFISYFAQILGTTIYQSKNVSLISGTAAFLNEPFSAPASSC